MGALYAARICLVGHQIICLLASQELRRTIPDLLPRLQLRSFVPFTPTVLYLGVLIMYSCIWRNPFSSFENLPLIFFYISLSGCIAFVGLQTVSIEAFRYKLKAMNDLLECHPKRQIDLEHMLARVAKHRVQFNSLIDDVNRGLGPILATTVIVLCIRLSFGIFSNFAMSTLIINKDAVPNFTSLFLVYPRTAVKIIVLVSLAHAGERFNSEIARSSHLLDCISTSNQFYPPIVFYQIEKCRSVIEKRNVAFTGWGIMNIDHTLLVVMFNFIFSMVMVLMQFQMSETVSSTESHGGKL
ncbi:uncharacterized protein LOC132205166 isoform X2 [Neocloeon triangulifer]|uniref:uncharacterized protein LOC132205166 isoform X2 n=1 Tax=Neocloeon triangulifer TaxID=2078957 RepID=UPI00286EF380|nr:uncharacterized protein LOC132205166 isoform X2 [Neocloeon triangulifer]